MKSMSDSSPALLRFISKVVVKGVLNNFSHFGSARLFSFIFASNIKYLLIYDI